MMSNKWARPTALLTNSIGQIMDYLDTNPFAYSDDIHVKQGDLILSYFFALPAEAHDLFRLHNVGVLVGNTEEPPLLGSSPNSKWRRVFYQAGYLGGFKRIELNVNATYVAIYSISSEASNPAGSRFLTISEVEVYGMPDAGRVNTPSCSFSINTNLGKPDVNPRLYKLEL